MYFFNGVVKQFLQTDFLPRRPFKIFFIWLVLITLSVSILSFFQRNLHLSELKSESDRLLRIASQRADQHDAHLTALAVIVRADASQRRVLFLDIATTINRFYPRIEEVQFVHIESGRQLIGSEPLEVSIAAAISTAAQTLTGNYTLLVHPTKEGIYFLVKRSSNSKSAPYALALGIDAKKLLSTEASFWSRENVSVRLSLPNKIALIKSEKINTPQFSRHLASVSQPLHLEAAINLSISDLFPYLQVIGTILTVSFLYFSVLIALRQRERAHAAEQVAEIQKMETKLAHASRVNAMGEMASGMAHELTQPLTAILAQTQAGLRVLKRHDVVTLETILQDTVIQSRRASSILERLRNWSRPHREKATALDLLNVLLNVRALLASKATQHGVQLKLHLPPRSVIIMANQVEMEQVVYNIVHNAFEALENIEDAEINLTVNVTSNHVILDISDNGPGVSPEASTLLFTPFYTTRESGTGLGLSLSQMLVERANGEVSYVDGNLGATFRVVLPLAVL